MEHPCLADASVKNDITRKLPGEAVGSIRNFLFLMQGTGCGPDSPPHRRARFLGSLGSVEIFLASGVEFKGVRLWFSGSFCNIMFFPAVRLPKNLVAQSSPRTQRK